MSQVKRQLNYNLAENSSETYAHEHALQTIGMRIRKAVSEGYQVGDNMYTATRSTQQISSSNTPAPELKRVPLPSNVVVPPMLSNATTSFGSSFEEWENNLDNRLKTIDDVLIHNKEGLSKRRFDSVDNDW
jgi:hypothetical protein